MAALLGDFEGRFAKAIAGFQIGLVSEQHPDDIDVTAGCREQQRRPLILTRSINISAFFNQ